MIKLLDPGDLKMEINILKDLKDYGINHLTKSPSLGWNYALDHIWFTIEIGNYIKENGSNLHILDVGCGNSKFHRFAEEKFDVNITGIDRPQGYCNQKIVSNVDISKDFLEITEIADNSVDIVYWLSAIEHNEIDKIEKLYAKSMQLLKKGGMFLATLAVSEKTYWFEPAQQTNICIDDLKNLFKETDIQGDFDQIVKMYRKNILYLKSKYKRRFYGKFGFYKKDDPKYIVGGIKKTK